MWIFYIKPELHRSSDLGYQLWTVNRLTTDNVFGWLGMMAIACTSAQKYSVNDSSVKNNSEEVKLTKQICLVIFPPESQLR